MGAGEVPCLIIVLQVEIDDQPGLLSLANLIASNS